MCALAGRTETVTGLAHQISLAARRQRCQRCLSATRAPAGAGALQCSQCGLSASPRAGRAALPTARSGQAHPPLSPKSCSLRHPWEKAPYSLSQPAVLGRSLSPSLQESPLALSVPRAHQVFGAVLTAEGKEGRSSEQLRLLQFHTWAGSSPGKGPRDGWLCWMELLGLGLGWGCSGAGTYTGLCANLQWQRLLVTSREVDEEGQSPNPSWLLAVHSLEARTEVTEPWNSVFWEQSPTPLAAPSCQGVGDRRSLQHWALLGVCW